MVGDVPKESRLINLVIIPHALAARIGILRVVAIIVWQECE
jgi:hypothetical protein